MSFVGLMEADGVLSQRWQEGQGVVLGVLRCEIEGAELRSKDGGVETDAGLKVCFISTNTASTLKVPLLFYKYHFISIHTASSLQISSLQVLVVEVKSCEDEAVLVKYHFLFKSTTFSLRVLLLLFALFHPTSRLLPWFSLCSSAAAGRLPW